MKEIGNKVVLIAKTGYSPEKDHILQDLVDDRIALFCAVGKDCIEWENKMDELCIGDGSHPVFITTTSHPDETSDEVVAFAKLFAVPNDCGVRIIDT